MSAPPSHAPAEAPGPAPAGSRLEQVALLLQLVADLIATPFHLALFLLSGDRPRRRLLADMTETQT